MNKIIGIRKLTVAVVVEIGTVVAGCMNVITGDQLTTITMAIILGFMGSNILSGKANGK